MLNTGQSQCRVSCGVYIEHRAESVSCVLRCNIEHREESVSCVFRCLVKTWQSQYRVS